MRQSFTIFIFLGIYLCIQPCAGKGVTGRSDSTNQDNFIKRFFNPPSGKKIRIYPMVDFAYNPETSIRFGGSAKMLFKLGKDTTNLTSSIDAPWFYYTLNKHLNAGFTARLYINQNYRISARFRYMRSPGQFFGIGNNTRSKDRETYSIELIKTQLELQRRVIDAIYAGVVYEYDASLYISYSEEGKLSKERIKGANGYRVSGIGPSFQYDTRDNNIFPTRGINFTVKSVFFIPLLGSDDYVARYEFRCRNYKQIGNKSHVIAFDGNIALWDNTPPFTKMSKMDEFRGIQSGRYIDRNLFYGQTEYRFPIYWRFRGVAFAGIGDVLNTINDLSWSNLKYSFGAGLRFVLDPRDKLSLRIDYAIGKDWTRGFYFGVNEVF